MNANIASRYLWEIKNSYGFDTWFKFKFFPILNEKVFEEIKRTTGVADRIIDTETGEVVFEYACRFCLLCKRRD